MVFVYNGPGRKQPGRFQQRVMDSLTGHTVSFYKDVDELQDRTFESVKNHVFGLAKESTQYLGPGTAVSSPGSRPTSVGIPQDPSVEPTQKQSALQAVKKRAVPSFDLSTLDKVDVQVLGLLNTKLLPFDINSLKQLFPNIPWSTRLRKLLVRGLLIKVRRSFSPTPSVLSALEKHWPVTQWHLEWVQALEEFPVYPDLLLCKSFHLFSLKRYEEMVDIAHALALSLRSRYLIESLHMLLEETVSNPRVWKSLSSNAKTQVCISLAICSRHTGHTAQASANFKKALIISTKARNAWGVRNSHLGLGIIEAESGNTRKGMVHYERVLSLSRRAKDYELAGMVLHNMATLETDRNPLVARKLIRECLNMKFKCGDATSFLASILAQGNIFAKIGDLAEARRSFRSAQRLAKKIDDDHFLALALHNEANTWAEESNLGRAIELCAAAYKIAIRSDYLEITTLSMQSLSRFHSLAGDHKNAIHVLRDLEKYYDRTGEHSLRMLTLVNIAKSYCQIRKYADARDAVGQVLKQAKAPASDEVIAEANAIYFDSYFLQGRLGPFASSASRKISSLLKNRQHFVAATLLRLLARRKSQVGETRSARQDFVNSIEQYRLCKNRDQELDTLKEYYTVVENIGDFSSAITILKEISRRASKYSPSDKSAAIDEQGVCLQKLGNFTAAIVAHSSALMLSKKCGDRRQTLTSLHNLGELMRRIGEIEKSRHYFSEAVELAEQLSDVRLVVQERHHLALAIADAGKILTAVGLLRKCRQEAAKYTFEDEVIRSDMALGNLCWRLERFRQAEQHYRLAVSVAQKTNQRQLETDVTVNLCQLLAKHNDARRAKDVFSSLKKTRDWPEREKYLPLLRAEIEIASGRTQKAGMIAKEYIRNNKRKLCAGYDDSYAVEIIHRVSVLAEARNTARESATYRVSSGTSGTTDRAEIEKCIRMSEALLLLGREKEHKKFTKTIVRLAKNDKDYGFLVLLHQSTANYYWDCGCKRRVSASRAHMGAMAQALNGGDIVKFSSVGAEFLARLMAIHPLESRTDQIIRLRMKCARWVRSQNKKTYGDVLTEVLCWPLELSEILSRRELTHVDLLSEQMGRVIYKEAIEKLRLLKKAIAAK
jgi:tetratricopeptide (TPR) repeat protein